jgi:hypothetical protein
MNRTAPSQNAHVPSNSTTPPHPDRRCGRITFQSSANLI